MRYEFTKVSKPDYIHDNDGKWWMQVERGSTLSVPLQKPPEWIDESKAPSGTIILRDEYDKYRK